MEWLFRKDEVFENALAIGSKNCFNMNHVTPKHPENGFNEIINNVFIQGFSQNIFKYILIYGNVLLFFENIKSNSMS